MAKVFHAYDYMVALIANGYEFSIAHEMAAVNYKLNQKQSRELIDLYDKQ